MMDDYGNEVDHPLQVKVNAMMKQLVEMDATLERGLPKKVISYHTNFQITQQDFIQYTNAQGLILHAKRKMVKELGAQVGRHIRWKQEDVDVPFAGPGMYSGPVIKLSAEVWIGDPDE